MSNGIGDNEQLSRRPLPSSSDTRAGAWFVVAMEWIEDYDARVESIRSLMSASSETAASSCDTSSAMSPVCRSRRASTSLRGQADRIEPPRARGSGGSPPALGNDPSMTNLGADSSTIESSVHAPLSMSLIFRRPQEPYSTSLRREVVVTLQGCQSPVLKIWISRGWHELLSMPLHASFIVSPDVMP
jgi:hypothetical protein